MRYLVSFFLLLCVSCQQPGTVIYLQGDERLYRVLEGDVVTRPGRESVQVPWNGWVISDSQLVKLYEAAAIEVEK